MENKYTREHIETNKERIKKLEEQNEELKKQIEENEERIKVYIKLNELYEEILKKEEK